MLPIVLICLLVALPAYAKYDGLECCRAASSLDAFHPTPTSAVMCNQEYNSSLAPAPSLYIPYSFCKEHCDGFGLSQGSKPGSWAAPIVQFILPSIIFSMSIPRRKMLTFKLTSNRATPGVSSSGASAGIIYAVLAATCSFAASGVLNLFHLFVLVLDNIIWIAIILTLPGPMMLSGLYEAVLDWQILSTIMSDVNRRLKASAVVELLVTVVSGNLLHEVQDGNPQGSLNPQIELTSKLCDETTSSDIRSARLLGLLSSQVGFGVTVGAPVIFYLGAFVYTILDLSNKPSDQDAAISLAFGVEWMIIVHVAIIGSCLLATNNPSTASVVAGLPPRAAAGGKKTRVMDGQLGSIQFLADTFDTEFQPVVMWERGQNKRKWVKNSAAWRLGESSPDRELSKSLTVGWFPIIVLVLLPTFILINLPPIAGAVVAWKTPPVGWGCRSLSFVCYAATQFFVVVFFILTEMLNSYLESSSNGTTTSHQIQKSSEPKKPILTFIVRASTVLLQLLYYASCLTSLFFALGGTLMQVIGVYRNCFCYVNTPQWFSLDQAYVQVANDTAEQRLSNHNWIVLGGLATGFMGLCCWWGWWYQKIIRERYRGIVGERCPVV